MSVRLFLNGYSLLCFSEVHVMNLLVRNLPRGKFGPAAQISELPSIQSFAKLGLCSHTTRHTILLLVSKSFVDTLDDYARTLKNLRPTPPSRSPTAMYNYPGKNYSTLYTESTIHDSALAGAVGSPCLIQRNALLILTLGNPPFGRAQAMGFPGQNAPPGMGPSPGMSTFVTPTISLG